MRGAALGLDVGTSALKAVAVDESGEVIARCDRTYPLLTPRPGWSEQRPEEWWEAARSALRQLAQDVAGEFEPRALGLSGQMHGMVAVDEHGEVVRPAILWNDQRTGDAVRTIEAAVPSREMIERTGNPAITGFQLAKVVWLRQAEPENFERTRHVLFPKDFIGYRLTGELFAEPCDASGSNAFNLHAQAWDADILDALGIDARRWPQVMPSKAVVGAVQPAVAAELGLPPGLDVVAGAGDNAAAAYGLGLSSERPQLGSVSLGTSGVISAPRGTPRPDPQGRLHLFCHADGGFFLLGVTLAAAGSLGWFREKLAPDRTVEELVGLAAQVPTGAMGVTFKPYLSGERTPHLDPSLRASFHGLSLAAGLPEMARAVLEGVAFSLREALQVMEPLGAPEQALLTGGGARSPVWSQMVADVLQLPLGRSGSESGPAYGAARLALESLGGRPPHTLDGIDWIEPGDFEPFEEAYARYRRLGP
ncbi:MAG TPA: xylulokinase [Trueperaceae bacterium]